MTKERSKAYYYFISTLTAFMVAAVGVYATTIGTNVSVTGTLDSSGAATMSSTLSVTGNSSLASADIGGAYTAGGGTGSTITAAGKAQFNGNLEINGFATTTASNGNLATEGTLTVTGNSVLTSADIGGAYTAGGGSGITLTTAGKGQFNGDLEINGFATTTALTGNYDIEGSFFASSTMAIGGISTFYGSLRLNGFATTTTANGTFDTEGSLIASSTLAVGGISTLYNDLRVNSFATTTAANGNFATNGTLTVVGSSTLEYVDIGGTYSPGGSAAAIGATGRGQFNGNLEINGFATTTASNGNLAVQGTLGSGTTTPSQEFSVEGDGILVSNATTTVTVSSTGASTGTTGGRGGCIQMEGVNGTFYRIYAIASTTNSGGSDAVLRVESGSCQ